MKHANIPSVERWAGGPHNIFLADAAAFSKTTVNEFLKIREQSSQRVPKGAIRHAAAGTGTPHHPVATLCKALDEQRFAVGLARNTKVDRNSGQRYPTRHLTMYIQGNHADIKPYLDAQDETNREDSNRWAHTVTLTNIHAGCIMLNAFNPGLRAYRRARQNYEGLGESAEYAIQRTFMTSALVEEISASPHGRNLPPLSEEANLDIQRTRGLYGLMHEQGIRPYSYDDMGAVALCASDLTGINDFSGR